MKVKVLKEAADKTMPLNLGDKPRRAPSQNAIRSARHMLQGQPAKYSSDPEIQKRYLKRHGLKSRQLANLAQKEAERPDFLPKMTDAIQKDPTAADRIEDAIRTRELKQDVGQTLLNIAKGQEKAITAEVLQQYAYILALEYSLIHAYRWGGASWTDLESFVDAWLGKYLHNPTSDNPKAYAHRHKKDMEAAQKQGFIKDFDPEDILYTLRESKSTIKCKIRRKK